MTNQIFNIGVDLSTKKTGIVITENENWKSSKIFLIENISWSKNAWNNFPILIKSTLIDYLKTKISNSNFVINLGIELIRSSDDNSQKFHFYAGMLIAQMQTFFKENLNVKLIEPNEWFRILALNEYNIQNWSSYGRVERKNLTLNFAFKTLGKFLTEDEADAFAINYVQNWCECSSVKQVFLRHQRSEILKQKKEKAKEIISLTNKLFKINLQILNKQKLEKLTPKQKEKLEFLQKKAEQLSGEINAKKKNN